VTLGIVIVCEAAWRPWPGILVTRIASWARHSSAAARARVRARPWPLGMVLANPAAVFATIAFHSVILNFLLFRPGPETSRRFWRTGWTVSDDG
jgi:hypothetical protein